MSFLDWDNLDVEDYFSFTDLVPGSAFSIELTLFHADEDINFRLLDSAANLLAPPVNISNEDSNLTVTLTGLVPASGELVVAAELGQDTAYYGVDLDASRVPEPSTGALTAIALAGLSFLRRGVRSRKG